ncbi:MAG: glutaredoxin 3 [Gammaproteobacteria bacterium]|nr:glutaredoxin 3 [Gammaproteobacteria bacterium]
MPKVEVYCTQYCPYCVSAKKLLESKNVEYEDIRIDLEPERQSEMVTRSKRTSVPQIFIDDYHVGGCDDLFDLEAEGTLDSRLGL